MNLKESKSTSSKSGFSVSAKSVLQISQSVARRLMLVYTFFLLVKFLQVNGHMGSVMICWDRILSKEVLKNVIGRALDDLNNIFQDEFNTTYLKSQRMSDSFYHITESSELN